MKSKVILAKNAFGLILTMMTFMLSSLANLILNLRSTPPDKARRLLRLFGNVHLLKMQQLDHWPVHKSGILPMYNDLKSVTNLFLAQYEILTLKASEKSKTGGLEGSSDPILVEVTAGGAATPPKLLSTFAILHIWSATQKSCSWILLDNQGCRGHMGLLWEEGGWKIMSHGPKSLLTQKHLVWIQASV